MEERGRSSMSSESVCVNYVKPEPESVFNEQVHVKEEAQYTKVKEEWDDSGAGLADLYAGHEVKDELVLGPEGLQPPDIVFSLHAAQVLDVRKKPVLRDCVVRLERINDHETLFCIDTSWGTAGRAESLTKHAEHNFDMEKETIVCDICEKNFTIKTGLMEHVMTHAHQSTEQEESGRSVTDNAAQALDVRRQPVLRDCVVRLERIDDHKALFCTDTSWSTAGRAESLTKHAEHYFDMEKETIVCDICEKNFTIKTGLMEHAMTHAHQSTEQAESGCSVTDKAAQALDVRRQPVLRDCVVRLERIDDHKALFCTDTSWGTAGRAASLTKHAEYNSGMEKIICCNTNISAEKEAYKCGICEKKFTMKTGLMEHEMTHVHQSTEQEERGRSVTDNAGQTSDGRERPVPRDCVVRLERVVGHEAPLSSDTCRGTAGRAARLTSHADNTSAQPQHRDTDVTTEGTERETYICDICKKRFSLKTQLLEHIMVHVHQSTGQEESRRGVADSVPAGAGASRRGQQGARLLKARERTRAEAQPHSCGVCEKKFTHLRSLKKHERIHTGDKHYSCGICNMKFTYVSELHIHKRVHSGQKPYSCEICTQKFSMLCNLKTHKRIHTGEKPYSCQLCKKKFTQSGNLKKHERTHTGAKPFSCGICKQKFTEKGSLQKHGLLHTGEKPYTCEICKQKFGRLDHLGKHERTHTGEKPYFCKICNKKFANSGSLYRHQRSHTGEKPYFCRICQRKFADKSTVNKHQRIHTGEKPYSCGICKKNFAQLSYLKSHERLHTDERPYSCGICNKKFKSSSNLNIHDRTHTGVKPYSCETCKRKFAYGSHLKEHEVTHTGEKLYWCDMCKKGFNRKCRLAAHILTHKRKGMF